MKKLMAIGFMVAMANFALAQTRTQDEGGYRVRLRPNPAVMYPDLNPGNDDVDSPEDAAGATRMARHGSNLTYHGGAVLHQAQVVEIYWGSHWGTSTGQSDKSAMMAFFANFGTTGEYNTITQYNDGSGYIQLSNLTNTNWVDSTEPPTA